MAALTEKPRHMTAEPPIGMRLRLVLQLQPGTNEMGPAPVGPTPETCPQEICRHGSDPTPRLISYT